MVEEEEEFFERARRFLTRWDQHTVALRQILNQSADETRTRPPDACLLSRKLVGDSELLKSCGVTHYEARTCSLQGLPLFGASPSSPDSIPGSSLEVTREFLSLRVLK